MLALVDGEELPDPQIWSRLFLVFNVNSILFSHDLLFPRKDAEQEMWVDSGEGMWRVAAKCVEGGGYIR